MTETAVPLSQEAEIRQRIAQIDDALASAAQHASYSIGGRSASRQPLTELHAERGRLVRQLKQILAIQQGVLSPGAAVARFSHG